MDKAMTPTLDALVRELREAMAQATPGPWHDSGIADPNGPRPTTWIYGPRAAKDHQSGPCVAHSVPLRDAAYIALCSPANMATLLDALEEAQKDIAAHTAASEELMGKCREAEAEAARLREQLEWQAATTKALLPYQAEAVDLRAQVSALHTACAAEEQAKREAWDETRAAKAEVSALQGELAEARAEADDTDTLVARMGDLLSRTAVALKGPEPPLTRWSTHDVPEVAATVVAQRDAAREALVKCTADRDELAAMYLHARLASRQIDLPVDAQRVLDEHRHELYQDAALGQPAEPQPSTSTPTPEGAPTR